VNAPRPREEERKTYERPHVLIVTDDPSLTEFLGEGLVMGGFWTSVISHGLQVLEVFRLRTFDMIVVDRDLGTFDAIELIERLRGFSTQSTPGAARTDKPLVIISSDDPQLSSEDRERLGVAATLQAPLELEDVVRELHATFARWREAHPDAPLADASPGS
jgi:DNA-binding response OmpR family regulator